MNGETPTADKHRRGHWSQFRLRTLLLATSGCGIVLAFLAPLIESYRNEWRIYRELSRLPYPIEVALEPKAPAWLRPFGAGRFMQRIVAVEFYDCDDDSLALAGRLPAIEYINVRSQRVTARGLKHLEGCGRLAHLSLFCPNISDAALESLRSLGKLKSLSLTSPRITNEGLKNLSDLTELRQLTLDAPKVSDDGLRYIGGLALWELRISASVTDCGLRHLLSRRHLPWSRGELPERQLLICVRPGKTSSLPYLSDITSADMEDVPLYDALGYISQLHGIKISTRDDLNEAGIDPLIPITINTSIAGRRNPRSYRLYDLLSDILQPIGLDWKLGTTVDLEIVPLAQRAAESPNLLKFRASWPQCMVIVDW